MVVALARWVIVRWNVLDQDACSPGWQLAHALEPTYPASRAIFGAPVKGGAALGRLVTNPIAATHIAEATATRAPRDPPERRTNASVPSPTRRAPMRPSRPTARG